MVAIHGLKTTRRAFTLIEMLMVVSILMIITVAVVAVAPRFTDDRKLSRAADQIAQYGLTAKQRALRDQVPTGLRLFPDPQHAGLITELQYIQQPDDFKGGKIGLTTVQLPLAITGTPFLEYVLVAVPDPSFPIDFTGGFADSTLWPVQPGDFLEIKGTGLVHRILQVIPTSPSMLYLAPAAPDQPNSIPAPSPPYPANTVQVSNANQLAVGMIVQGGGGVVTTITAINNTTAPPAITLAGAASGYLTFLPPPPPGASGLPVVYSSSTAEYRVIRQPRVLTGETPLQLPAGICIDPTPKMINAATGQSVDPYAFAVPGDI